MLYSAGAVGSSHRQQKVAKIVREVRLDRLGVARTPGVHYPHQAAMRKKSGREKTVMDARRARSLIFIDSCCFPAGSAYSMSCRLRD